MSLPSHNPSSRLACLAVLAAFAGVLLVGCGAGPGAKAQPDPVKIKDVVFEKVGTEREIPLGDKFSGEGLAYTATSSNKAVATVMVDNDEDILTVTAVGAGEATITVTAADSQKRTARQTFSVTVPKPTTSESEPGAPTVKDGAPTSVDFEAGESTTKTVTLSQVFEGDDLTYSAPESDDTDVAIASISNRVLIIRAGDPGTATITVTATNADGNATHRIAVTVPDSVTTTPEPETPTTNNPSLDCPSLLTIDRNTSKKCTFPSNATLREPAGKEVEVTKIPGDGPDVWTITARKRGTYKITIESGGATKTKLGEITVIVPNSQPLYTHPATADLGHLNLACSTTGTTSPYTCTISGDGIGQFFTDPDGSNAQLKYSLGAPLDSILIDAEEDGGWVSVTGAGNNMLMLEVLKEVTKNFSVSIYSHDDTEKSDLPVVLTVTASESTSLKPKAVAYSVNQGSNGDLNDEGDLDVGPRIVVGDASHSLTFQGYNPPGVAAVASPFQFVKILNETAGIKDSKKLDPVTRVAAPTLYHKGDMPDSTHSNWNPGFSFLVLESSNPVEEAKWTGTGIVVADNPVVNFKLKEGSRRGWIKITYYVVYAKDNYPQDDAVANDNATRIGSEQLYVNIVACNSPPDPLTECP